MFKFFPRNTASPVTRRERLARILLVCGLFIVVLHLQSTRGHEISLDVGLVGLEHRIEATENSPRLILTAAELRHLHITLIDSSGETTVEVSFAFDADHMPPPRVNTGTTVLLAGTYRMLSQLRFESGTRNIVEERENLIEVERDGAHPIRL